MKHATRIAAAFGLLAVVLGAFGAHGLKDVLGQNGTTAIWEKAAFYHFIHAVMLFILAERATIPKVAWVSFLVGLVIFSGSLTPIGGVSFIVGWACLILKPARN